MTNKKLLTMAIGATLIAPGLAAQADVKIYGQIYGELASEKKGTTFSGTTQDDDQGNGRLGVLVSEDLGNGLKAIGNIEWSVDVSDNCAAPSATGTSCAVFTKRVGNVGIAGGFGEIAMGTFHVAYKTTGGVLYDPFVATSLQARPGTPTSNVSGGGMSGSDFGHGAYVDHMVQYKTPNFGGFTAQVQYSFDEGTSGTATGNKGDTAVGLKYGTKDWEVIWAYAKDADTDNNKSNGKTDKSNKKIGGKVKFGAFTVAGQYEYDAQLGTLDAADGKYLFLSGAYQIGAWTPVLNYGKYNADAANKDATYTALGVKYAFSKNATGILGYRKTNADDNTKDTKSTVLGLELKF